jgi:hypothetical protein
LATLLAAIRELVKVRQAGVVGSRLPAHRCRGVGVEKVGDVEVHRECVLSGPGYDRRLVDHLSQYAMFRRRDRNLLLSLSARALAWRERNKVSEHCFRRVGAASVMIAFVVGREERAALAIMKTPSFERTMRIAGGSDLVAAGEHPSLLSALVSSGLGGCRDYVWDRIVGQPRLSS